MNLCYLLPTAAVLLGEEIFVCGGQADKEVINFAESYSPETQLWEPIPSRMAHPRVGLGELLGVYVLTFKCVIAYIFGHK